MIDCLRYYDLETYLFEDVRNRFLKDGFLSAFDFFSIVIWKANRAKGKVAQRLLANAPEGPSDLDVIVHTLTRSLFDAQDPRERLRILMEDWGFRLPMASAVLTVLWPDFFTVYDTRICNQLDNFHKLANWSRFERIWVAYGQFREAVSAAGPKGLSLRKKDRHLWGKSSAGQLQEDIERCFKKLNVKT